MPAGTEDGVPNWLGIACRSIDLQLEIDATMAAMGRLTPLWRRSGARDDCVQDGCDIADGVARPFGHWGSERGAGKDQSRCGGELPLSPAMLAMACEGGATHVPSLNICKSRIISPS